MLICSLSIDLCVILHEVIVSLSVLSYGSSFQRSTLKDLSAEFKRHDSRSDGVLEREEFTECLVRFGFKLRKELQRDLCDSLSQADQERGSRSRRAVDYGDFVAALKAEHEAEGDSLGSLDRVKESVRRELKRGSGMMEVSSLLDTPLACIMLRDLH